MTNFNQPHLQWFRAMSRAVARRTMEDRENFLLQYSPERLCDFVSITLCTVGGDSAEMVQVASDEYILHSTQQPAWRDRYYLFGQMVKQNTWFRVLGYTREEQVVHRLRWSTHA